MLSLCIGLRPVHLMSAGGRLSQENRRASCELSTEQSVLIIEERLLSILVTDRDASEVGDGHGEEYQDLSLIHI